MSIVAAFAQLADMFPPDAFPPCRQCGRMLLMSEGVESPPLGPICYPCLTVEAERLRAALEAVLDVWVDGEYQVIDIAAPEVDAAAALLCEKSPVETAE